MIFFFDANISRYAAYMLGHFDREHEMRASVDWCEEGTSDVEWMREVASWDIDPVIVSGDARILRNKAERRALKECGCMFVYLAPGWTKLPWREYAWKIVKVWPGIAKNVEQARYPMVFEVSLGLKVQSVGRVGKL